MPDSSADRDPLERLAEEFVARFRAGERPSLTEYVARLPDRADEVRELFPALVELEQLKPNTSDRTGDYTPAVGPADPVRVGEFRILRRVGVGGMGAVYEAIQESLGRHVALKLLPLDAVADPKKLERFRREAKAAARLHHSNIVPVYGTGEADGRHFYAMQFIAGHPLDAVIDEVKRLKDQSAARPPRAVSEVAAALVTGTFAKQPSPLEGEGGGASPPGEGFISDATLPAANLPPASDTAAVSSPSLSDGGRAYWATVARLGEQAADALAYAHGQGIQHRYIKPANLLLDLRGTLWVADFGLAKSTDADDLTHTGDVIGTLRYMAPERFEGQGDQRADIYALGLTLYELLALRPAFVADTRAKLVELALAADPPKPRAVNPAIPRDLETIVLKAIQRDPAMRYQTAGELADDLRRYVEDRSILARRATPIEQAWRWCRRNPAVASLLATLLMVFAVGAAVSSVLAVRADAARHDADKAREQAEAKRAEAQTAREGEAVALLESRRKVVGLDLRTAERFADSGNHDASLLWYARAWQDDREAADREPDHRLHLGLALQKKPALVGLAVHDERLADARIDDGGTRVITRTDSGRAVLWDIRSARVVARLEHPGTVTSVALTRYGKYVVTGGADGGGRVWDGSNGAHLRTVSHGHPVASVEFQPGGTTFSTGGGNTGVRFWDAASGESVGRPLDAVGAYCVMFSGDGARAVTATEDGQAQVWEVSTGERVGQAFAHRARDDYERRWNVRLGPTLSPDGKTVLTSSGSYQGKNYEVSAWEVDTGRRLWQRAATGSGVYSQTYSPDGRRLLMSGSGTGAYLVDPATGATIQTTSSPRECQKAAMLGTDQVVTASTGGSVQVTMMSGKQVVPTEMTVQHLDYLRSVTALPDGRRFLLTGSDGTARLYDLAPPDAGTVRESRRFDQIAQLVGGNGQRVVIRDSEKRGVRVTDQSTGAVLLTRTFPPATTEPDPSQAVISPNGRWLATGDFAFAGAVEIWDIETSTRTARFSPHRGHLGTLRFSDDGTRLAVSSSDTTCRVWDSRTGLPVGPVLRHHSIVRGCDLSSDGRRVVTADRGGNLHLWDAVTGYRFGQWRLDGTVLNRPPWFGTGDQVFHYGFNGGERSIRIEPTTAPAEAIPAYLELVTGQRIDPATEGVEVLPPDSFTKDPERYLQAFRAAQSGKTRPPSKPSR